MRVANLPVQELTLDEADLEQVFLHIMQSGPPLTPAASTRVKVTH